MWTDMKKQASSTLRRRTRKLDTSKDDEGIIQYRGKEKRSSLTANEDGIPVLLVAIDFTAFWAFLFLYFMFNCIYWSLLLC